MRHAFGATRPLFGKATTLLSLVFAAGVSGCGEANSDEPTYTRDQLLDPNTCKECHSGHFTEWSGSMHAYASTDPIFRAMNARGQAETNGQLGDFCVNCHAPMAVREKATTDGLNLDTVSAELQGVTCYFCHQVTDVAGTHNNPLVLANDTTMRGGISNPVKYKAHKSAYSKLHDSEGLESSKLCGACHDIVVPAHFSGAANDVPLEQTYDEWSTSYLNDETNLVQSQSCGRCHFTKDYNVPIAAPPNPTTTMPSRLFRHEHTLPAVDTALIAGFPQMSEQADAVQKFLDISLRVQICVDVQKNIAVTLENNASGHRYPSGASQDRRIWVELHAYDVSTPPVEVCSSGVVPPGGSVTETLAPPPLGSGTLATVLLRDVATKKDGSPAFMFWDVAALDVTNTIPIVQLSDPNTSNLITRSYSVSLCTGKLYSLSKVSTTVWVEPVGTDVLDDMAAAGYPLSDIKTKMPRFAVLPHRGSKVVANPNATLEWTPATAAGDPENPCVQTTQKF